MKLIVPNRLKRIIEQDNHLSGIVYESLSVLEKVSSDNLYYFEEYTDHGLAHIQKVLNSAENIITDETYMNKVLGPLDVTILILAILLHDIGMQTNDKTFRCMIDGYYETSRLLDLDKKSWKILWEEYIDEIRKYNPSQLDNIFGSASLDVANGILKAKDELTGKEKKLIGEFIRRYHPRIAHEFSINGIYYEQDKKIEVIKGLNNELKDLAGLLARSHGIEIRDTFDYLKKFSDEEWMLPFGVNIIYLMAVIRIADYIQYDSSRTNPIHLKLKTLSSPISKIEHEKHLSISFTKPSIKDPETLYVEAKPSNSFIHQKLIELFKSIQYELDISWAILGEVYGKSSQNEKPSFKYRRIKSNLDNPNFLRSLDYVSAPASFGADFEILKLLIAPLYGNNPSFGIRELLQNAIDACWERKIIEKKRNCNFTGLITIELDVDTEGTYFKISDNGKGMRLNEILNYFLKAGASFKNSSEWKNEFLSSKDLNPLIHRIGRFGIGVLAGFLIGNELIVETKSCSDEQGYLFRASLDSKFINIKKVANVGQGTSIKIYITDTIKHFLLKGIESNYENRADNEKYFNKNKWDKWFTLGEPKIVIKPFNQKKFSPYLHSDPDSIDKKDRVWNEINPDLFPKVLWTFDNKYVNVFLTCNGIIIPGNFHYTNSIFPKKPRVSVFDTKGNLNLTLNRSSLLNEKRLPFEKLLTRSMYRYLISEILLFKPEQVPVKNTLRYYTFERFVDKYRSILGWKVLYLKDGFIFLNDAFISNQKNILHVRLNFKQLKKDIFSKKHKERISPEPFELTINRYIYNIAEISEIGEVRTSRKWRGYSNSEVRNAEAEKKEIEQNIFASETPVNFSNLDVFSIVDVKLDEDHQEFYQVLQELLGSDFVIPYEIKARKEKFANAFKELKL